MTDDFLILNDGFWPALRIPRPRRKAAVDYSNVGYVERPRNWCSRSGKVIRCGQRVDIRATGSLRQRSFANKDVRRAIGLF